MNAADLESLREPQEGVAPSVGLGKRCVSAQQTWRQFDNYIPFTSQHTVRRHLLCVMHDKASDSF